MFDRGYFTDASLDPGFLETRRRERENRDASDALAYTDRLEFIGEGGKLPDSARAATALRIAAMAKAIIAECRTHHGYGFGFETELRHAQEGRKRMLALAKRSVAPPEVVFADAAPEPVSPPDPPEAVTPEYWDAFWDAADDEEETEHAGWESDDDA